MDRINQQFGKLMPFQIDLQGVNWQDKRLHNGLWAFVRLNTTNSTLILEKRNTAKLQPDSEKILTG